MVEVANYSIAVYNKPIFEKLNHLGGNKSKHIAKAVKEYLYRIGVSSEGISPEFHDNAELWKRYLNNLTEKEAEEFNKKFEQIGRIFKKGLVRFGR